MPDLQTLYQSFNQKYFGGELPPCEIVWSGRLTRAAGNIDVRNRVIKLSIPILNDAFLPERNPNAEYIVCGVLCRTREAAIIEILKHEMIHLWLFERGLPCGHTREFKVQAGIMGQTEIRHQIAVPPPKSGWEYSCPECSVQIIRIRRFSRAVACSSCCQKFNNGQFHKSFKLRGKRILAPKSRLRQRA